MSLTGALGAARSGLGTNSIQADLLARNISNAGTEGYTRKSADLVTIRGGGVSVAAVDRQVDNMLDRLDRGNQSLLAGQVTVADGMSAYTDYLGQPTDETSPVASLSRLKDSLITLSVGVSDRSAQMAAVSAGREMAARVNDLSETIDGIGEEVEMNIRYEVSDLNTALHEIAKLNRKLLVEPEGSDARVGLRDDMDRFLDKVSDTLDIQTVAGKNGMVNVLTGGGTELVSDRLVHDVTYDPVSGILRAGETDMTPGEGNRAFTAGALAGLFTLRNDTLPNWSSQLDTMAAALIEGFERVAPINGGAGLFTDDGNPYDPTAIDGLAARIGVNAIVDQDAGGDPSLLQSGGDPALPAGDSSVVDAMLKLIDQQVQIPGREFGDSPSLTRMATGIVGAQQKERALADAAVQSTTASANTISASRENLRGVNVDDELQKLIVVEQSYAANARVLTSITEMLDSLLRAV